MRRNVPRKVRKYEKYNEEKRGALKKTQRRGKRG